MTPVLPQALPHRQLLIIGTVLAVCFAMLTWLNQHAELVAPEQHDRYMQQLRELRELDARIDAELLANRLELTRNYDALTDFTQRALAVGNTVQSAPSFLATTDRAQLELSAKTLRDMLHQKAAHIDHFKRDNSVLRNSLAFFPVAADQLLAHDKSSIFPTAIRLDIGHYVRHVLAFARAPHGNIESEITSTRQALSRLKLPAAPQANLSALLRHGDVITQRLGLLDQQIQNAFELDSRGLLETLSRHYGEGYLHATQQANHYRLALYAVALMLTAYLAWSFVRLNRIGRSLAAAHAELSDRYAAQLAAEKQLKLNATAFLSAHDGITLTDAQGNILDVNPAFTRITGWERDEVIGRNPRVLKSGRHDRDFYAAMWKSILETGNWRGEIWNRNKYGDVYPELLSISTVRDAAGTLTNFVAVFADISRIKAQEQQLKQMAYYDTLTNLPNRALLSDRLLQSMSQTPRSGTVMAIAYLDLDGFKEVNDTLGHEVGDRVLIEMASRLRDEVRGGDTVARLGGDEFVILLLGLQDRAESVQALQRILEAIAMPLPMTPLPTILSGSIGVTIFPDDDEDPDTLLRHADQAMYLAKQAGKNRFHFFDPIEDRDARTRHLNLQRIRTALEENEFVLYYQPKVDMRAGRVLGAEALIRWNHPKRGLLPPIDFLPLVDNDPLAIDIGDWVIETALTQMENWHSEGITPTVSVNVDSIQLQHAAFVQKLQEALARHPAVAGQLELEVLETAALEDVVKISQVISTCHEMGVAFALDDFGTGYSSLSYLKRLPAATIKIDQSFVRELLNDQNNLVIVQGVLGLANAFQRNVIAEGVESPEHGRLLLQLGCDQAQGYGIAKPMPAAAFAGWTRQWRPDPAWDKVRELFWEDADYPLFLAEVEHRNWVAQLIYTTSQYRPISSEYISDVTHCHFGQWYHDKKRTQLRYAGLAAYRNIDAPHRKVHEIAERINAYWHEGRIDAAQKLIPELAIARDEVLAALADLQLAVATRRPSN